jgi:hypothetical protein
MSNRRPMNEVTDPGRPPEAALDATLEALGEPVAPEARNAAESAGLEAARYHGAPHAPPRAHEPARADIEPTVQAASASRRAPSDTLRMSPREVMLDGTTVPRAAPPPSRMSAFAGALLVVVLVLGGLTWVMFGRGSAPTVGAETPATMTTTPAAPVTGATNANANASASPALAATAAAPSQAPSASVEAPTARVVFAAPAASARAPAAAPPVRATPTSSPASVPAAASVVLPVAPPTASTSRTDLSPIQ